MNYIIFITFLHMPIHICINQAENNRFISYQCLIMTFSVRNCFFVLPTVSYFPKHAGWFPIFIYLFLDSLNPIIGNIHSHAIIKAITTILYLSSQARHTRNLFCNGNSLRIYFMNQFVCQCQIADGIIILMSIKVVAVIAKCFSQSVAIIKHGCHPVKTEAIKMIFFQPIFTIGK